MPTITCPICDMTFGVKTSILGKKVQCAYCREVFVANTEKDQEIIILRPSSETVQKNTIHSMGNNAPKSPPASTPQKQSNLHAPAYEEKTKFGNYYDVISIWKIALHQKKLILILWEYFFICIIVVGAWIIGILPFPTLLYILFPLSYLFLLPVNRTSKPLLEAMGKSSSSTEGLLFFNFFLPIIGYLFYLPSVFSASNILKDENLAPGIFGVPWATIQYLEIDAVRSSGWSNELHRQQEKSRTNEQETLTALKQYSSLLLFGPLSLLFNSPNQQEKDNNFSKKQ